MESLRENGKFITFQYSLVKKDLLKPFSRYPIKKFGLTSHQPMSLVVKIGEGAYA